MADSASSPANPQQSEPPPLPNLTPNQSDPLPQLSQSQPQSQSSSTPLPANPNSNPQSASTQSIPLPPPPTLLYSTVASPQVPGVLPPSAPSFRPLGSQVPQFSPLPNPAGHYQNSTIPPPGVAGAGAPVPMPQMQPMMSYQVPSNNPALRHYAPMPNGYAPPPQGTMNPTVSY